MSSSIEIKKAEEPFISVSGCVFFDKNKDGIFDASEMPIVGIGLKITDSSGAETFVTTNGVGNYPANISAGNYTVEVTDVPGGYILTTVNDKQSGSAEQGITYMSNIGYYIAADVGVNISVD